MHTVEKNIIKNCQKDLKEIQSVLNYFPENLTKEQKISMAYNLIKVCENIMYLCKLLRKEL